MAFLNWKLLLIDPVWSEVNKFSVNWWYMNSTLKTYVYYIIWQLQYNKQTSTNIINNWNFIRRHPLGFALLGFQNVSIDHGSLQ